MSYVNLYFQRIHRVLHVNTLFRITYHRKKIEIKKTSEVIDIRKTNIHNGHKIFYINIYAHEIQGTKSHNLVVSFVLT